VFKDPDRALARKAGQGDRRALGRLYDRHRVPVFSLLVRIVGDRSLAEDAFQETWIKVMNGIESYDRTAGTFRAWVSRIAHNAAIDRLRRETRHTNAAELDAPIDDQGNTGIEILATDSPGPERAAVARHEVEQLAILMGKLPERQRLAVLLRHQQGMSYAEIAAVLGVPEGTAKTSVHRGLNVLKQQWEGRQP
jgi:RNA polymerase sigma-70 factor (ECF subfamily)